VKPADIAPPSRGTPDLIRLVWALGSEMRDVIFGGTGYCICSPVPGILYFFLFKYVPLFGYVFAFQNYNIFKGITGSDWVGLKHFQKMFSHYDFLRILNNTLLLGLYDLVITFPVPILLAILLNEVRMIVFKRLLQTIVYMPHFLSWVAISGIFMGIFSMDAGVVNKALGFLGMQPIYFLGEDRTFVPF